MIECVCQHCGVSFRSYPSRIGTGRSKYCSGGCAKKVLARTRERHWRDSFTELLWLPEPNSGCWLWLGTTNRLGYGTISKRAKSNRIFAHRAAYLVAHGSIPDGLDVLHRCDVRCCVNPDHLFVGTHTDNMRDMMRKGRHRAVRGDKHGAAKVTPEIVQAIRASIEPRQVLAARYGISKHTVHGIRGGGTWKHVIHPTIRAPHRNASTAR
jgi:hypothetical protein